MDMDLNSAIVRIFNSGDKVVGAGLLIASNEVLTCAHVVASAAHLPRDSISGPTEEIRLDFPLLTPEKVAARVTVWDPERDIAGLNLQILPVGAKPVQLIAQNDLWGHPFRAFGFPQGYEMGVWSAGILRAQTGSGWVQIEGNEVGYRVQPGFSGGPVWDQTLRGVIGIVAATDRDARTRTAFLIPTSQVMESWPELSFQHIDSTKSSRERRKLKVFLCHASKDKPSVREIYHKLRADGHDPWLDEENLLAGQRWQLEIPNAVRSSDAIIICLSHHSITKTGYVQKEIKYALDAADERPDDVIFLIPVRLEKCEIPERLKPFHYVNLYEEKGYERLILSLQVSAEALSIS